MTAPKSTLSSTALVRVLALPIMVGTLAGCDYASRLPDAPSNLGGYDVTNKPPSVTGSGEQKRLPPPPVDAFANLKAPVEDRTKATPGEGLALPPKGAPKVVAPKAVAAAPKVVAPVPNVPAAGTQKSLSDVAFAPLEFEAIGAPSAPVVAQTEFVAPPLDLPGQGYTPPAYTPSSETPPSYEVVDVPYTAPSIPSAPIETYAVTGTAGQVDAIPYVSQPTQSFPIESYALAATPSPVTTELQPISYEAAPVAPRSGRSPVAILRSRLPNGAVVNVHPVIGAPGAASSTLARSVVMMIGAPINESAARNAEVTFDLRGKAERNTEGYVAVEWTLYDTDRKIVGTFPERQNGEGWKQMSDGSLRAMGQRVADRISRNSALRGSTLYAAANNTPNFATSPAPVRSKTFTLERGATLASAPLPRISPRATTYNAPKPAPVRVAEAPRSIPTPPAPAPVAAAPRPLIAPAPIRRAPRPQIVTEAPTPLAAPAPVSIIPPAPQVTAQAPRVLPAAPAPTFDTLRPVGQQAPVAAPTVVASGPRPLVFRGVKGAPGDGDQALGREVAKLLQQSGARLASQPQPGALFLTADVSKTSGANADRIEIIWRVQDGSGTSIGQVTQANDVPRGMLDNAWGEDAFYAAEGARDGIMELLQSSGALDS